MRDMKNARRLQAEWRAERKRKGRCWDCPAQAEKGKVRCGPCRKSHNENNRKSSRMAGKPGRPRGPYKMAETVETPEESPATVEAMLELAERSRRAQASL